MTENLIWTVKNGELEDLKEIIEKQVSFRVQATYKFSSMQGFDTQASGIRYRYQNPWLNAIMLQIFT
jgi:hypothetical protein